MKPNKNKVAERIQYIRGILGMSLSQMAERLGISRSTLNSYLRALALPPENIVNSISMISHYSKDWIYYGSLKEYIQDVLSTSGYEKFVEDFPYVIDELYKIFSDVEDSKYPHVVILIKTFEKQFYFPKLEEYVNNLIKDYSKKVELYPLKEGSKVYSSDRYVKNVWMTLGTDISYGEKEKILEVANNEYEKWVQLYKDLNPNGEDLYEYFIDNLILTMSTKESTSGFINYISQDLIGREFCNEKAIELFQKFKILVEEEKNKLKNL